MRWNRIAVGNTTKQEQTEEYVDLFHPAILFLFERLVTANSTPQLLMVNGKYLKYLESMSIAVHTLRNNLDKATLR